MDAHPRSQAYERARLRARHLVYERLALLSTAIWVVGTLLLFINTVPVTARPAPQIMISMLVPLIPASLPWLFYPWISNYLARRWVERELGGTDQDPARPD